MITIETKPIRPSGTIQVPGSKSYTHRTLIAAALSNGQCRVVDPLRSEDTLLTLGALKQMGIDAQDHVHYIDINGNDGCFEPSKQPIEFQNSGTSMRLFGGLVALGTGDYTLTGSPRMCERPMQPLLDSLNQIGVTARCRDNNGCPPVTITGGQSAGGRTSIDCSVSSQFLSALLLIAPRLKRGLTIEVVKGPVSKPYIDMTVDIMNAFGIQLEQNGHTRFEVPGGQPYQAGSHQVEPDASQAGYFWAAAAITGSSIKVAGVTKASRQGDIGLADLLAQMGCRVDYQTDGVVVSGGTLNAVDVDMGNMPDVVPTLAVTAAFAQGTTVIRNVAHLRAKECDRLAAVTQELAKMGIETRATENELHVRGGKPRGATIETYDDHRIAMSFALAGLTVPGVRITNPGCVAKSFPNYWDVLKQLYR
jgi:3-phosphoshikimate 1-carboxyvinyltransferase